jgi:hypothetical protein
MIVTVLLAGPTFIFFLELPVPFLAIHAASLLVVFISMTNLLDALCLLLFISLLLLLLTHRVLWPLIKRPLYAANRKGLVKNTKLLGTLGTMLLMYAFPNNPFVKLLAEFLHKLKGGG